ncbi:MAG: SelB C-terminal domain-containing protein, partial [Candidatus Marinimicrobia bacterium]|nr:SelB C-terminal domain-containing protein [Candidatus Neomarinimicrobiota bacterium]
FKDLTASSRKYAVPLLEFCDKLQWTLREGDHRNPGVNLKHTLSS